MKRNSLYRIVSSPLYISVFLFSILGYIALWPYLGYDESLWTYVGRLWVRNGIPPYTGTVENKTPGIFYIYALSDFLFKDSIFFIRILGVFAVIITSNVLFLITKKLHSRLAGVFGMYIFGLSMGWTLLDGFAFSQAETYMILFSTVAFYFILIAKNHIRSNVFVFIAGASMGLAIAFKQIALTTLVAFVIVFLIYTVKAYEFRNKFIGFALFGFGVFVSTLLSYFILYLNDVSLYEYIEGAWLILFNSGSKVQNLNEHINNFIKVFLSSRIIYFYPLVILFFLQKRYLNHNIFYALLIWLCFDFIGVNASGYYYGHQIKQLLPVITIISSISLCNVLNENKFKTHSINFIIAIIILFFPYEQIIRGTNLLLKHSSSTYQELGYWIKEQTEPSDYIFIVGNDYNLVASLSLSNRVSSSKYFHGIFVVGEKEQTIVCSDLIAKPPIFILKEESDTIWKKKYGKAITNLLNYNYNSVKTVNGIVIFKRNTENLKLKEGKKSVLDNSKEPSIN